LLREILAGVNRFQLLPAPLAALSSVLRVHDRAYAQEFLSGEIRPELMRRIGFPWSPQLVVRTLASVGGTLAATTAALEDGWSGTLAGGTHHAYAAEGSGFCVFNDLAIAIHELRARNRCPRAAVIDLDVHQGDGTAALFAKDPNVWTFSAHGRNNFPFRKKYSTVDIEFGDGTGDNDYLTALRESLPRIMEFRPDIVFFQAGVDPLAEDTLGKLSLSRVGLAARDRLVFETVKRLGVPLVITLGGGYANPIEHTVEAHAQTFLLAADLLPLKAG
jgi:acetoin utilization deacetylase AcuC-like enzyme